MQPTPLPASIFKSKTRRSPNQTAADDCYAYGAFSGDEIRRANDRHDAHYGWSLMLPSIYTNNRRLPETVVGEIPA